MTHPAQTEHDEQAALFEYAEWMANQDPAWEMLHVIPNGQFRPGQRPEAGLSYSKGYPDIGLDVPRGRYHGLRLEIKTANGRLSKEQEWWLERLNEQGYFARCVSGFETARMIIEEYLKMGKRAIEVQHDLD